MEVIVKTIEALCHELTTGATNSLFDKSGNQSENTIHLLTVLILDEVA